MIARTNSGEMSIPPVRDGGTRRRNGRKSGSVIPHRKRTIGLRGSGLTQEISTAMMITHWAPVRIHRIVSSSARAAESPTLRRSPRSEERPSDPDLGGALLDGHREVVAHAERQLGHRQTQARRKTVAQS